MPGNRIYQGVDVGRSMIDRLEEEVDILDRNLEILKLVIEREPIGIVMLSNETGYPHHKVRYSLRLLEEEGLVVPSSQGATTTDDISSFASDLNARLNETISKLESISSRSTRDPTGSDTKIYEP